jgi:hypothetical protein
VTRIVRRQLGEVLAKLPDFSVIGSGSADRFEEADLFICALGFEERTTAFAREVARRAARCQSALVLTYSTNRADNDRNRADLFDALRACCDSVDEFDGDDARCLAKLRSFLVTAKSLDSGGKARVTVDISVMANRLLLKCIKALLEFDLSLRVVYSEARIYHPTEAEYLANRDNWRDPSSLGLERGVQKIDVGNDYPGEWSQAVPTCLVLFPTFRKERATAVIEKVDGSLFDGGAGELIWVVGAPHNMDDNGWRVSAMKEINEIPVGARCEAVCTFEYKKTLAALDAMYGEFQLTHNIVVAPLGSKMQALGVSLFCFRRPDVRVVTAMPKEYNAKRYSEGVCAMWSASFGDSRELKKQLLSVGTLHWA